PTPHSTLSFFASHRTPPPLHSFPTRRSSDLPAQPCLSSRIPWGTPVTVDALAMVERAEEHIRSLGFRVFRVRHIVKHDAPPGALDRKSTRLNSSHVSISYAVFCLKKKKNITN